VDTVYGVGLLVAALAAGAVGGSLLARARRAPGSTSSSGTSSSGTSSSHTTTSEGGHAIDTDDEQPSG
jgi:hypothetical protein